MKDNKQNLTDLIGALAVDIEDVKKKLDAKDSSDKNEALKRLEAKLEPVIRFFNGNAPENVNAIFGSKEAIEEYKQSHRSQREGYAQIWNSHYQGTAQQDIGKADKPH